MQNFAAVFPLSTKKLRGGGVYPPPVGARVNREDTKWPDLRSRILEVRYIPFVGIITLISHREFAIAPPFYRGVLIVKKSEGVFSSSSPHVQLGAGRTRT